MLLLKKLAKQREKQKEKRRPTMDRAADRAIHPDAVDIAGDSRRLGKVNRGLGVFFLRSSA